MQISDSQSRAIAHGTGPALVLAGPGSGKTLVITRRIAYLIQEMGVSPEHLLVITFTRAAAKQMQERFFQLSGHTCTRVTFGTFHSIFFQMLKLAYRYTAENILRDEQKVQFLTELVRKAGLETEDEREFITDLAGEISLVKNEQIPLDHFYSRLCPEVIFRKLYLGYQEKLAKNGLLDFDDMLVYSYELLKERPDICAMWQKRFPYILVDEFQDINMLQYETLKLLGGERANLFVVGDDDQSIYRFRGAKPEIMQQFARDFPQAERILLETNFRSTPQVVSASLQVIEKNRVRFSKALKAANPDGAEVEIKTFTNPYAEAVYVVQWLMEHKKRGGSLSDTAILFRTNTGARPMAERLMEYDIPFIMRDTLPNLYDHWISRDVLAYIRLAMGNRERGLFLQVMNRPKRYLSRDALESSQVSFERLRCLYEDKAWMVERIDQLEEDLQLIRRMKPYGAVNYIRRGIGYDEYLEEYAQIRGIHAQDLLDVAAELQEGARDFSSFEEWFRHMEDYRRELEKRRDRQREEGEAVVLSTLHSAKGLEFPHVFIPDLNERILPHKKAVQDADMEEERRLLYVGMTRAKETLHLLSVREQYGKRLEVSRFIKELEEK